MAILPHLLKLAAVCALLPVLQGAGCRSHHTARLTGSVTVPDGTEFPPDVRMIYRKHDPKRACTGDWAPCIAASAWVQLRRCNGKAEDSIVVKIEDRRNELEACTAMVGTDYAVDLLAFVDVDHDGVLDSGEAYGAWQGNPLTRERERDPVEIEIDRTLP